MTRQQLLQVGIIVSTAVIAGIDIALSSDLVVARLFTLPLALCAFQASTRLLAATTVGAILSTILAGFLVHVRSVGADWTDAANRGLLAASLLVFSIFIFLVMRNVRLRLADADRIKQMSDQLAVRNRELTGQVAEAVAQASASEIAASLVA